MLKLETAMSETHTRPHFTSHTQSSLMKRRTPMKLKKKSLSSIKDVNGSKKPQGNVILRMSGIHKKRSNILKQSRSMQMMIMILKQQRDRRATVFLPGSELTETTYRLENSFISFQSDLIKNVSHNFKKCGGSPAKLATLHDKPTKVLDELEKHAENASHAPQDEMNSTGRDNSENIRVFFEDRTIVGVDKLQLSSSDEEELVESHRELEVLHRKTESEEKPNEDYSEIEMQVQDVNAATNRKRTWKTWMSRKGIRNEYVDVNRACRTDLQNSKHTANPQDNSANDKLAVNNVIIRKRDALQKNLSSKQRVWKPPGISRTWVTESATALQPISHKSSHLAEKSTISSKNKHSTKYIEAFNSESTSTSTNQAKMLMKENRDPRTNRMTKICEPLTETKQRQRPQSGGTLPKRRRSRTKVDTKVLDRDNATVSRSKSRHCQTRPIAPRESLDNSNVEQHRTKSSVPIYGKRTRTLEVIHTLRKIIDSVTEGDNAVSNDREKDGSEIQMSNRDASSRNSELHIFTEDINLDGADRSSRRSISTQTELDLPCQKINVQKNQDLKISTRIVATQTSPRCNRNVVEIGCNTSNTIYNDAEVSCNLIDFTSSITEVNSATVEGNSTLNDSIHTESSSVKHIEINVESEGTDESRELPLRKCKETLNIGMSLKLDNYDSAKISAKTSSDAVRGAEKISHEKACQISMKLSENSDDKTNTDIDKQGSTECFNNHSANSTSVNNLFPARARPSIYDCDVSCSSEEIVECLDDDVQYENTVASESKVEGIPSDVIAAFELAAERARNIHKATLIYYENLMSRNSEKRDVIEDYETEFSDDRCCLETRAPFTSCVDKGRIKSEREAMGHFANNDEDFDGFSTCSSRDSSSDRTQFERFPSLSRNDYFGTEEEEEEEEKRKEEEENIILSENERAIARSILNERSNLKNVKSLIQLLEHRTQEEYALELLQSGRKGNNESFETEWATNKNLALPTAIEKPCLMSRENLLPLICCVVCTVVFWFLQFSFRCDSTK